MCQALKVKQDVFSGRRPFQSRQIPDNLSKFPSSSYRPRIIQPCLFPTVCSKVGNRKLGPFFAEMRAVYSLKLCHSQDPSDPSHPRDLNLTGQEAAAVAVVGEKFTMAVLAGSVARSHSNPHSSKQCTLMQGRSRVRARIRTSFPAILLQCAVFEQSL